jgi:hypothetical protein
MPDAGTAATLNCCNPLIFLFVMGVLCGGFEVRVVRE